MQRETFSKSRATPSWILQLVFETGESRSVLWHVPVHRLWPSSYLHSPRDKVPLTRLTKAFWILQEPMTPRGLLPSLGRVVSI